MFRPRVFIVLEGAGLVRATVGARTVTRSKEADNGRGRQGVDIGRESMRGPAALLQLGSHVSSGAVLAAGRFEAFAVARCTLEWTAGTGEQGRQTQVIEHQLGRIGLE